MGGDIESVLHITVIAAVTLYAWSGGCRFTHSVGYGILVDAAIDACVDIPKAAIVNDYGWFAVEVVWLVVGVWAGLRAVKGAPRMPRHV